MFSTMTESRPFQSLYSCKDCGDNKLFADNWYISQSLFEYLLGNRSVLGTARKNQINKPELFKNKKSETDEHIFCHNGNFRKRKLQSCQISTKVILLIMVNGYSDGHIKNWEFCKIMTRKWVNKNDAMKDNYSFVSISHFFISFRSNIQFFSNLPKAWEKKNWSTNLMLFMQY